MLHKLNRTLPGTHKTIHPPKPSIAPLQAQHNSRRATVSARKANVTIPVCNDYLYVEQEYVHTTRSSARCHKMVRYQTINMAYLFHLIE